MQAGKIAGWIGVEGYAQIYCNSRCSPLEYRGHQLGNSLGVLRQYYSLGVRYITLTHTCHNAFADSGGFLEPLPPLHYGLSQLGKELITEMNR
jgi:membrane dipeptidase